MVYHVMYYLVTILVYNGTIFIFTLALLKKGSSFKAIIIGSRE